MTFRWNNKTYATFESMRDEVVFAWLDSGEEDAAGLLGCKTDNDLTEWLWDNFEQSASAEDVKLSRDDIARGVRQARLAVEQQGLS